MDADKIYDINDVFIAAGCIIHKRKQDKGEQEMSIFFLCIAVIVSIIVLSQTLSKRLPEKESVLWMLGCAVMIIMSLLPKSMDSIANAIGVDYPPALYPLLAIMFLGLLVFRLMIDVEDGKRKENILARKLALLEEEIEHLKDDVHDKEK